MLDIETLKQTPLADDSLQHYGVKGMKWGKRLKTRVQSEVSSIKRERSWSKVLRKAENMSTKDINKVAQRAQLENDLKRLSKTKFATKKDKVDYRSREKMSDAELLRKVSRLRAKDNLNRQASDATRAQRELGGKIVKGVASVAVKVALTGNVSPKDIISAALNANAAFGQAKQDVANKAIDKVTTRRR